MGACKKMLDSNVLQILRVLGIFFLLPTNVPTNAARLQPMHVNREKITLSGFSSGGTFAQQLQFSYSSLFDGIAVFSHTYYRCGPGTGIQQEYDDVCTKLSNFPDDKLYDPKLAVRDVQKFYREKTIENPENLKGTKLFVYAGLKNILFSVDMSMRILEIYGPYIRNPQNIKTVVQNAGVLLPSDSFGNECSNTNQTTNFFIGNCGYAGPFEALKFLLGSASVKKPKKNLALEPLKEFDQTEFFPKERNDMDDIGYMYIPKACKNHRQPQHHHHVGGRPPPPFHGCFIHFYFHGCFTGRDMNGNKHILNSGYLEVAETNNIIMIFPQAKKSEENTIGCWDTYGFTGRDYATQKGAQVRVVRNMLSRVLGEDIQFRVERDESTLSPVINFGTFPYMPKNDDKESTNS